MRNITRNNKGFTLIELMIVVAIIGVLAAVAIPAFMNYIKRSKTSEAKLNIREIFDSAIAYYDGNHVNANGVSFSSALPVSAPSSIALPGRTPIDTAVHNWTSDDDDDDPVLNGWGILGFSIGSPTFYKYDFSSVAGTAEVAEANATAAASCPGYGATPTSPAVLEMDINAITVPEEPGPRPEGNLNIDAMGFYVGATGDLDGNAVYSCFWRVAEAQNQIPGGEMQALGGLRIDKELE